jgi:L,D-peptidoglycan transpeptidase YkuD (ErfK/YbiS/YcfS/YnhG family)
MHHLQRLSLTLLLALGSFLSAAEPAVRVKPAPGGAWVLEVGGQSFPCAVGRSGVAQPGTKREGDGMTPSGDYAFRELLYRADKVDTKALPIVWKPRALKPTDGWCDEAKDAQYNRLVPLPYAPSHEELWRQDDLYDLIVPIGYNDAPVVPGKGSAIFFHVASPTYGPTAGCVAVSKAHYLRILSLVKPGDLIRIEAALPAK